MDGGLAALLNQPYSLAHVGNVSAYLTKVLEKTEDVRDFHWLLPKLLAHIFGVDTRPCALPRDPMRLSLMLCGALVAGLSSLA